MFDVGRMCIKIAGRDAGSKCVVVDVLEDRYVLIDGLTRRRKCNVMHLEPLADFVEIEKGASHDVVVRAFKDLGIEISQKSSKEKTSKPAAVRKSLEKHKTNAASKDEKKKKLAEKKQKRHEELKKKAEEKKSPAHKKEGKAHKESKVHASVKGKK